MGWSSFDGTPKTFMEKLRKEYEDSESYALLDIRATNFGRHIWIALEDNSTKEKFVVLCLLEKRRGWMCKEMDESCGPYTFDCPLSLLKLTEGNNKGSIAKEWRKGVEDFHKNRQKKFEIGDTVEINGEHYKIVEKKPKKKSYIVQNKNGGRYKCTPARMNKLENSLDFILSDN